MIRRSTDSSADDFATKYLEGYYTHYTAPEETGEAMQAKLEDEDEALTPMEVRLREGLSRISTS